jgi:hypothetical protein
MVGKKRPTVAMFLLVPAISVSGKITKKHMVREK